MRPLKGERRKVLAATATFLFPRINTPSGIDVPVPHPTMRDTCLLARNLLRFTSSDTKATRPIHASREHIKRQGFRLVWWIGFPWKEYMDLSDEFGYMELDCLMLR
jgi:hypothetical protein